MRQRCGPAGLKYVRPSAANADLMLDGAEALDWKVEQVLAALRGRGLLRTEELARLPGEPSLVIKSAAKMVDSVLRNEPNFFVRVTDLVRLPNFDLRYA